MRKKARRDVAVQVRDTSLKNEKGLNSHARYLYHSRTIHEGDEPLNSSTLYLGLDTLSSVGKTPYGGDMAHQKATVRTGCGNYPSQSPLHLPTPQDTSTVGLVAPCLNNIIITTIDIIHHQQRPGTVHCFARPLNRSTCTGKGRSEVRRSVTADESPERSIPLPQPSPEANRARQSADKMRAL